MIVTGIRRSNEQAINSKLKARNITDVISASEVKALPDLTIVEALRRVPGLSVLPATDNEHPRDEAAVPVIRGLNATYNNVTIDGLEVASPGTPQANQGSMNRGVRLDILPSSMITELQVIKTFTPDLDPNAVGGAINMKTRSAFENGGAPFVTADASVGRANDTNRPFHQPNPGLRFGATASTTFGSDHQFGAVLSANYQRLSTFTETHMTSDSTNENFFDNNGNYVSGTNPLNLGNGYAVPQNDKYWYVQDKRDRYGVTLKLEAKPSDSLYAYATGGYYFFRDNMTRNELIIYGPNQGASPITNQTPTSGSYSAGQIEVGYSNQVITTKTKLAQAGLEFTPDDRQKLSLRGSWSRATYDEPIYMIKFESANFALKPAVIGGYGSGPATSGLAANAFNYSTANFNQVFAVNPSAYYNLANYNLLYWRPDYKRSSSDEIKMARLDYSFNQGPNDKGFGAAIGAAYTDDTAQYNVYRDDFQLNANAAGNILTLNGLNGPINNSPLFWSNGLNMLTIDPALAKAALQKYNPSFLNSTNQVAFSTQDNFLHHEKIFGAYAMVTWRSDAIDATAGVHYDHTSQNTIGELATGSTSVAANWHPAPTSSSYGYFLPSALVTWHALPNLNIRAAYSKTLGRPGYDQYAARSAVSYVNGVDATQGATISIGNPNLSPRISDNFDLEAEYRVGGGFDGLLSAALFDKQIHHEIFNLANAVSSFSFGGTTYTAGPGSVITVTEPINLSTTRIRGIEVSGVANTFGPIAPFLKNFGASFNAALMDGHMNVPNPATGTTRSIGYLVGQPRYTLNASLFYAKDGFELRAAFNRQGKALRSIVANVYWQDFYWAPRNQLDLQASYQLRQGVTLFGQVTNATHSRMTSLVGPNQNLLKDSYSVPTVFWLGVRFTPKLGR
ncbi:TonB-dependent receptor [Nostoc sp. 3335mG]|nr:TonB-dependent receptor [Nostoc sp. 3335mG]